MYRFFVALAVLSIAVPPVAAQEQPQSLEVHVVRANVRDTASMNGEVVFQASRNDVLTVLDKSGDWYFIETTTGRRGYIHTTVVRRLELPRRVALNPSQASTGGAVLRNTDVIAMTKAGLGNDIIIGTLRKTQSTRFDLTPAGLVDLKNGGVSDEVIRSMVDGGAGLKAAPAPQPRVEENAASSPAPVRQAGAPPQTVAPQTPSQSVPSQPITRVLGLGGQAGGFTFGVGGSLRYWGSDRLGFQVGVSRYSIGSTGSSFDGIVASSNASVLQIAPALIYKFGTPPDPTKDVSFRPYAGGGVNIFKSSISASASGFGETISESQSATDFGVQGLFGVEIFFSGLPKFGVSGDIGYYSTGVPFTGFQVGGLALSIAGHWYVR